MIDSLGVTALRLIALPEKEWDRCGFHPRLWSTSQCEIAHVCGVTERAVRKWWNNQARPDDAKQQVLEESFGIQRRWWRERAPTTPDELGVTMWLLGLLKPDAEDRVKIQKAFGIPPEHWDEPASAT